MEYATVRRDHERRAVIAVERTPAPESTHLIGRQREVATDDHVDAYLFPHDLDDLTCVGSQHTTNAFPPLSLSLVFVLTHIATIAGATDSSSRVGLPCSRSTSGATGT